MQKPDGLLRFKLDAFRRARDWVFSLKWQPTKMCLCTVTLDTFVAGGRADNVNEKGSSIQCIV
jgi:hypothetical protein